MPTTIDIPGGTATFRDKLTTERQRRPIKRAAFAAGSILAKLPEREDDADDEAEVKAFIAKLSLTDSEAEALLNVYDATVLAYLESWTLPRPVPQSADELLDLDSDVYDALLNAARQLKPEIDETSFDPDISGKESPTGASSDSGSRSEAEVENRSIPTPSTDGSPTSTDASSQP